MMQLLPIIFALLLGGIALAYVLYPIYRRTSSDTKQVAHVNILANAQAEREQNARLALQEVELDYQLGNLGDADYHFMRTHYIRRAALAMKSRHEREQEIDAMIEEKLRVLKQQNEHVDE
jgi:hypothetical protein